MTKKPHVNADHLTIAQQIIADKQRWEEDGKMVTATLKTPEERAAAKAIQVELQRHVVGHTPDVKEFGGFVTVATKRNFYNEAHKQITKRNASSTGQPSL